MEVHKLRVVYMRMVKKAIAGDSLRSNAAAAQYGQFIERGGARSISPRRREGFYLSCDYLFNLKEKQRVRAGAQIHPVRQRAANARIAHTHSRAQTHALLLISNSALERARPNRIRGRSESE
jgi:hypothetical protein